MRIDLHRKSHELRLFFTEGDLIVFMDQPADLFFHMVKAFRQYLEITSPGNWCVGRKIALGDADGSLCKGCDRAGDGPGKDKGHQSSEKD